MYEQPCAVWQAPASQPAAASKAQALPLLSVLFRCLLRVLPRIRVDLNSGPSKVLVDDLYTAYLVLLLGPSFRTDAKYRAFFFGNKPDSAQLSA